MCYNYCTDLTLRAKFGFAKRLTGSCGWRSMLQSPPGGFVQESDQKVHSHECGDIGKIFGRLARGISKENDIGESNL